MISPEAIREKALKIWNSGRVLSASLTGESLFPLEMPFRKATAREALEQFGELRERVNRLREGSREGRGFGYSLEFTEVNHRQLGPQRLPSRIWFESEGDFLRFIGKGKELERFRALADQTLTEQPGLKGWLEQKPMKALENLDVWPETLTVCRFLRDNPRPGRYLRELDIPGVDGKFMERNRALLRELLDLVLPPQAVDQEATAMSGHGFERRYGFRYDEPLIRFRILDAALQGPWGVNDLSIPLTQFLTLDPPCDLVVITENKVNGLTFPPQTGAMVVFGLGYGISSLRDAGWLGEREILYWGDIDTHGFAILSQLRGYFPRVRSILMDRGTLMEFRHLWGREEDDKRCGADLVNLDEPEQRLYRELKDNALGENVRLEQERISFGWVRRWLEGWTMRPAKGGAPVEL